MAELRAQGGIGSPRALELLRRGWLSLEVASRALDPSQRFPSGSPDGVAWELAREGIYWGLRAERLLATGADDARPPSDLATLVVGARDKLLRSAGSDGEWAVLEASLMGTSFADFGELASDEQSRSARRLATFAAAWLKDLEGPRVRLDRLWFQRIWRTSGTLALIGAVLAAITITSGMLEQGRDVARGRPWRASSSFPGTTPCPSPAQECSESPFFFFHTLEEDRPWVELDLGNKQRIVAARIVNRDDCCADRAVPLAIQVSTDHRNWREVARRQEVFGNWYASFPSVSARWVRVQSLKRTTLHLHRVSILR